MPHLAGVFDPILRIYSEKRPLRGWGTINMLDKNDVLGGRTRRG